MNTTPTQQDRLAPPVTALSLFYGHLTAPESARPSDVETDGKQTGGPAWI